mmetsp:Transcript_3479/g.6572  ORF Transcript_3479/g.6572 Transcript_3479/m.6572 type:complete len:422 (+) Transcript_3479:181-1446(+)
MNTWTKQYVEALYLDTSILCLLIDRNRKQHYRASYFRRLDMLMRCMKRHNILVDPGDINTSFVIDIFESIKSEHDRIASIVERYKSFQKKRGIQDQQVQEQCWSLSTENVKQSNLQPPFLRNLKALHESVTQHLPEIISRIMFAAASLYTELSRGYFAPLCTVALGCISRIRVLLLQFGRDAVVQYHKTVGLLETEFLTVALNGGQLEKQTDLSVEGVKAFIGQYKLDLYYMNTFMDNSHYEHSAKMKQRKLEKIMQRGESNVSSMSEWTKDAQSDANDQSLDKSASADHALSDIIGELVDPRIAANSGIESMEEELDASCAKDDGDRNHELVRLMKEQSKKEKPNKRKAPKVLDIEERLFKLPKVSSEKQFPILKEGNKGKISTGWTDEVKSSNKKKDKSNKKKKKKRSKDVIDAIFDDL